MHMESTERKPLIKIANRNNKRWRLTHAIIPAVPGRHIWVIYTTNGRW